MYYPKLFPPPADHPDYPEWDMGVTSTDDPVAKRATMIAAMIMDTLATSVEYLEGITVQVTIADEAPQTLPIGITEADDEEEGWEELLEIERIPRPDGTVELKFKGVGDG